MLSTFSVLKKHVNLKLKDFRIDNLVFRLHYKYTLLFLLMFCAVLSFGQFYDNKLKCTHSDPTDSKKQLEHVIATFCYYLGTFTIPKYANKTNTMVHPGIGPQTPEDKVLWQSYYQWVPYVLIAQAVTFYIPHYIWKLKEKGKMKRMVEKFAMKHMLEDCNLAKEFAKEFMDDSPTFKNYILWLNACEVLNFLNVVTQIFLTNWFLNGNFLNFGSLVYTHYGDGRFDPMDFVFPKMTKCTFQKFGPSGSLQTHDVICVMTLNIINEKFYFILWCWYIILAILSGAMIIHRILSYCLFKTSLGYNLFLFRTELGFDLNSKDLFTIMENLSFPKWYFMYKIVGNLDPKQVTDLVKGTADYITGDHKEGKEKYTYKGAPTLALQSEKKQAT